MAPPFALQHNQVPSSLSKGKAAPSVKELPSAKCVFFYYFRDGGEEKRIKVNY